MDLVSFRGRKSHHDGSAWKRHCHPLVQGTSSGSRCRLAADVTSCWSEVTSVRTSEQTGTMSLPGLCHDGSWSAAALLLHRSSTGVPAGPLLCHASVPSEESKVVHPPTLGQSSASLLSRAGLGLGTCFRLMLHHLKPEGQEGKRCVDVNTGCRSRGFLQLPSARTFVKK